MHIQDNQEMAMPSHGCSVHGDDEKSQLWRRLGQRIKEKRQNINYLKHCGDQRPTSIHRVPHVIRKAKDSAYTPSLVSIGPLHRAGKERERLQAMEGYKLSYMHFLFHRTGRFNATRRACEAAVLEMEPKARTFYAEEVNLQEEAQPCCSEKVKFAEMLLVDGCFIIEFLYRDYRRNRGDPISDPILSNMGLTYSVQNDLLLLENQIPLFVLRRLFSLTVECIGEDRSRQPSLTKCVLAFFNDLMGLEGWDRSKYENELKDRIGDIAHILHLLHSCYLPYAREAEKDEVPEEAKAAASGCCIINLLGCLPRDEEKDARRRALIEFKHSATQLEMAGVEFQKGSAHDLFDINFRTARRLFFFRRKGLLEVPPFSIYDSTDTFLRNLIALEQCCLDLIKPYFSSHALLMDKLINSAEDVKLLEKAGVIHNHLGSPQEAAELFNDICKHVSPPDFFFQEACMRVNLYCRLRCPKFMTILNRDYFSSPWSIISFAAAFLLFAITILQTVFTVTSAV